MSLKRTFDFTFTLVGMVILLPLFVTLAIAVRVSSPGPVFFRQERVGLYGKAFRVYKFRTMQVDAESRGPLVSCGDDPRITAVGGFLRKYKLDEFPQLLNVLKGDMSLVGPRPEVPRYVAFYPDEYREILTVRPGITDFATIEYRNESELLRGVEDPEKVYIETILPAKIALYQRYLREQSFFTDLRLIVLTVIKIVEG